MTLADYLQILVFEDGERRPHVNRRACWRSLPRTAASSWSAAGRSPGPGSGNRRKGGRQSFTKSFIRSVWARTGRRPETSRLE